MRHHLFLFLTGILASANLAGQTASAGSLEIGAGVSAFFYHFVSNNTKSGPDIFCEYHFRPDKIFDFGARVDYKFHKDMKETRTYLQDSVSSFVSETAMHQPSLLLFADFNLLSGRKVRPFIGLDAGVGTIVSKGMSEGMDSIPMASAGPRLGLLIGNHFRLTADYAAAFGLKQQKEAHINETSTGTLSLSYIF